MNKVILLLFLALFIFSTAPSSTANISAADLPKMHKELNEKASVFRTLNMKASRNLLNAARVTAFKEYFSTKDPAERARLKKKIQKISLSAQKRFKVDEMCLISTDGREITRIVFDKIAPDNELSRDESDAPFFKASVKKGTKGVHVQDPYLSSDSKRWVIAYTSPIMTDDGKKPAFLHYEIPLSFFAREMAKGLSGPDEYLLIVGDDGLLWTDSRRAHQLGGDPSGDKNASSFFLPFDDESSPGIKKILGAMKKGDAGSGGFRSKNVKYSIVYKPLGYFDWSIAVVSRD